MGKSQSEILAEFDAAPEIRTPLELQSFLRCIDDALREIAELIVALCGVTGKWQQTFVADWTLYPHDECFQQWLCPEAKALEGVLSEYDMIVSVDAPHPRWLYLVRMSRPAVGDETIEGTDAYEAYYENVPQTTAKINFELESPTATRFAQYAREGRYDEIEEPEELRDFTDEGPEVTEDDLPEDYVPPEERDRIVVYDPRFRVKRGVFVRAFTRVAGCVAKRGKSAGRCVKVSADKEKGIVLTATDGETVVQETISDRRDFRVLFPGSFLVKPSELLRLFAETPEGSDERLIFALHFSFLTVKSPRFRYRAFVEAGDPHVVEMFKGAGHDYPHGATDVMPEVPEFCKENGYYEMTAETFRRLIRRSRLGVHQFFEAVQTPSVALVFKENEAWATAGGWSNEDRVWQRGLARRVAPRGADERSSEQFAAFTARTLKRVEAFLTGSDRVRIAISENRIQIQTETALLTFPAPERGLFDLICQEFSFPTKDAPNGRFFAGDLKTALRTLFGKEVEPAPDFDFFADDEEEEEDDGEEEEEDDGEEEEDETDSEVATNEETESGDESDSDDAFELTNPFETSDDEDESGEEILDYMEDFVDSEDLEYLKFGAADASVTLELRNGRLIVSKRPRLALPPIVEIPLKYCGNRVSVTLTVRRLYAIVSELPPDERVALRVLDYKKALFETRDGVKYLAPGK